MTRPVRLYLPLAQVALALVLLLPGMRLRDPASWRSSQVQTSYAINAPAMVVASFLSELRIAATSRLGHMFFSYVLYFILVAILWYAVAVEISGRTKGSSLTSLTRFRRLTDVTLVVFGACLTFLGVMNFDLRSIRSKEMPSTVGCLIWGIVMIAFYGRDLLVAQKERLPVSPRLSSTR